MTAWKVVNAVWIVQAALVAWVLIDFHEFALVTGGLLGATLIGIDIGGWLERRITIRDLTRRGR